ncbi:MAG: alpha/beta hydrolase [Chloroflexota bacterium]
MTELSIIALHGNGGGGFRFERAKPHFPDSVNFIAPTLPGFAGVPRDPAYTTLRDYADALHKLVIAQPRPRIVLGTGIGGAIVLEMVQHHNADVDGIILHAPVGTRLDTRLFPKLMSLPGMTKLGQLTFSSHLTRPVFRRLLFHEPLPDDYVNRFFDEYRRCEVFGQMFEIITAEWFATLKPVDVPGVLLWGEREKILSVDQLDDYKTLLPNHIVHVEPDWDHFPMVETPEQFAQVTMQLSRRLIAEAGRA